MHLRSWGVVSYAALGLSAWATVGAAASACNSISGIDSFVVAQAPGLDAEAGEGGAASSGGGTSDAPTPSSDAATDAGQHPAVEAGADGNGWLDARGEASGCTMPSTMCSGGCLVAHSDGLSQMFYDCVEAGTYNETQAFEACAAFTGDAGACANNPFGCSQSNQVCSTGFTSCACWKYSGPSDVGKVVNNGDASCTCVGRNGIPWY
jgi:hypothetical protein